MADFEALTLCISLNSGQINGQMCTLQIPQNLLRNVFLILETYSQIKKILENSFQNKKIYLAKRNFLVPSIRMFILI